MRLLALDVGSSSVKTAILRNGRVDGEIVREAYPTTFDDRRVEIDAGDLLKAVSKAVRSLGPKVKTIDLVALSTMAPSWLAMDKRGNPITPIVTHQDRRSIEIAQRIEQQVGRGLHLRIACNRPFPGGISSTTLKWFLTHEPSVMRRADLVGHVQTLLLRQFTGARAIDPSNASFTGLYRTNDLTGWSDELCGAIGVHPSLLPDVRDGNEIAGRVTPEGARRFGVPHGVPVLTGVIDGSAAMLAAAVRPRPGQMVNSSGSTDVLAVAIPRPRPDERLLTRALGVGRSWVAVSTMAAAGSALTWARDNLFADVSEKKYWALVAKLAGLREKPAVTCAPFFAGDRMSIEQRRASFAGVTLSTTREELLQAIIEALAEQSAERLPLLRKASPSIHRDVLVTGGAGGALAKVLRRDWPGTWKFRDVNEATLKGLGRLAAG
jgi:xylulokinase